MKNPIDPKKQMARTAVRWWVLFFCGLVGEAVLALRGIIVGLFLMLVYFRRTERQDDKRYREQILEHDRRVRREQGK